MIAAPDDTLRDPGMTPTPVQRVDGWLALDKPVGVGSTRALGMVRRALKAAKAGHGGTLDPLASGVLPIAFGEATKTVQWVMQGRKVYRFTLSFGEQRATDDLEGEVVATSAKRPSDGELAALLPRFTGQIVQTPPAFSALKIGGRRAYDLARAGETVILAPRQVRIDRLILLARPTLETADFEVECGKGTYIRSLARDLALAAGTVGHLSALRRTRCGPFDENSAISLDKLLSVEYHPRLLGYLLPVVTALDDIPALAVTEPQARRIRGGQAVAISEVSPTSTGVHVLASSAPSACGSSSPEAKAIRVMAGNDLVAIARIEAEWLRPVRVFNWT